MFTRFFQKITGNRRGSEAFCRKWAAIESIDYRFEIRHEPAWKEHWNVSFYDLHRWGGEFAHWNGHDVGDGNGMSREEAWKDLERRILGYERASSREEALIKAELKSRKSLPRGWGRDEYNAWYGI